MKDAIIKEIREFTVLSGHNRLKTGDAGYFDEPLVGFANGFDTLFLEYKKIIGEFHFTPKEVFEDEFGDGSLTRNTLTVISWILPISDTVIKSNRRQKLLPSREWAHTRYHGEVFNNELKRHMTDFLKEMGYRSVAPSLSRKWERLYDHRVGHASRWSERHAAYAAGLGTFSLSDGLITVRGIAHRVGSIITELDLEPVVRPYKGVYDYCLKKNAGTCGVCIKRCPAGAITENGHNKDLCFQYMREKIGPAVNEKYEISIAGCGLCQTKVPCERAIPLEP
jgi:epoxyqueuosine reductase